MSSPVEDEWTSSDDEAVIVGGGKDDNNRDNNRDKNKKKHEPEHRRHEEPKKQEDIGKKISAAKMTSKARATTVGAALISLISVFMAMGVFLVYTGSAKLPNATDSDWNDGLVKIIAGLSIFLVMVGAVVVVQMYLVMHASSR